MKDRDATQQKLIDAVGKLLIEKGYAGIGINAVAKEAGVDKVLIYRYFKDLDGLLQAFALQRDYFANIEASEEYQGELSSRQEVLDFGKWIFRGQLRQMAGNKELQEILLWELTQRNAVTEQVATVREREARKIMAMLGRAVDFDAFDLPAITAVITAGINYLVLRARTTDSTFNGIDLISPSGWARIENAIMTVLESLNFELSPKRKRGKHQ
jgi:AcrR family transcriptional regulator